MTNRVNDIYCRLKREILSGEIPPDLQVTEQEFSDRYGVSRTPMREVLLRLSSEGLIEITPRHGARVLSISMDDIREIYDILIALEPEAAARIAASDLSDSDLEDLDNATARMERALQTGDLDAWATADSEFHDRLIELCDNYRMRRFIKTLFDQAHRVRIATLEIRKLPVQSTEEHRKIIESIRQGDVETTRQVFRDHRQRAADELLALLSRMKLARL